MNNTNVGMLLLPSPLLQKIAYYLKNPRDFCSFGEACKQTNKATKKILEAFSNWTSKDTHLELARVSLIFSIEYLKQIEEAKKTISETKSEEELKKAEGELKFLWIQYSYNVKNIYINFPNLLNEQTKWLASDRPKNSFLSDNSSKFSHFEGVLL